MNDHDESPDGLDGDTNDHASDARELSRQLAAAQEHLHALHDQVAFFTHRLRTLSSAPTRRAATAAEARTDVVTRVPMLRPTDWDPALRRALHRYHALLRFVELHAGGELIAHAEALATEARAAAGVSERWLAAMMPYYRLWRGAPSAPLNDEN